MTNETEAPKFTTDYAHMNHHHELTNEHEVVSFGGCEFVANKAAIPLLKALDGVGLRTRTHHVDRDSGFISILVDAGVRFEVRQVNELDANRDTFNGQTEILIQWYFPTTPKEDKPNDQ